MQNDGFFVNDCVMKESSTSGLARSTSRWTSRPSPSQRSSRQQSVIQPLRPTAKPSSINSVDPIILLAAKPVYIPHSQPQPILLQTNDRSHSSLNAQVKPHTKIFSKRILSGGSVSFLLGTVAPFLDTSKPDIIEVSAEVIYDHVTWEDLQAFEHDEFEKELATKEYEKREKLKRREKARLTKNGIKRGRGRSKKVGEGDMVLDADQGIMITIIADSEEDSSESESDDESESDESSVRASTGKPSKSVDDHRHAQFTIEIPSSRPMRNDTVPLPPSIFDRGKVKVRSEATQAVASTTSMRLPTKRSRSTSIDSTHQNQDTEALLRQFQSQMNSAQIMQTRKHNHSVESADAQKVNKSTPKDSESTDELETESESNEGSDSERVVLLRQFQNTSVQKPAQLKVLIPKPSTSDLPPPTFSFPRNENFKPSIITPSVISSPSRAKDSKSSNSVISNFPPAISNSTRAKDTNPSPIPPQKPSPGTAGSSRAGDSKQPANGTSKLPPATSTTAIAKDTKPSTSPPQHQKLKPSPHHFSEDEYDDDYDDENSSKAKRLLQKFQPKTYSKYPTPTTQSSLSHYLISHPSTKPSSSSLSTPNASTTPKIPASQPSAKPSSSTLHPSTIPNPPKSRPPPRFPRPTYTLPSMTAPFPSPPRRRPTTSSRHGIPPFPLTHNTAATTSSPPMSGAAAGEEAQKGQKRKFLGPV